MRVTFRKQIKIPAAKEAADKERWKPWKKFRRAIWRKSDTKLTRSKKQEDTKVCDSSFCIHCWTFVHLKNADLEKKHQKYKGRVVHQGCYCEQWFRLWCSIQGTKFIYPHSQMTAAKNIDTFHGYQVAENKTADAVSAYTQVKNGSCWKFQSRNVQTFWMRQPRHKWPESSSCMEDPVVPHERNFYGHPLEYCCGRAQIRERDRNRFISLKLWKCQQLLDIVG